MEKTSAAKTVKAAKQEKCGLFWADQIARAAAASGKPQVVQDEKTPSGRVHVGALRGVIIHDIIHRALLDAGVKSVYYYGVDDFDPMDSLPVYLDKKKFGEFMGKPLCEVPAPDEKTGANNYAEYYFNEFQEVFERLDAHPQIYWGSDFYRKGKYNEAIRLTLENAAKIRMVYERVSGGAKERDWFPISVVCEECGKIGTTKVTSYDAAAQTVEYKCLRDYVAWAKGCGYEGRVSPFNGNAKLPWKAEWPAKWFILGVTIEGAGKDHCTAGGSRDVANAIYREVYNRAPPVNVPYEFFLVGGKKMSSSRGVGASAFEVAALLPPELLRFLMTKYKPSTAIDFNPAGETIPRLFDAFDEAAAIYFKEKEARDPDVPRIFALSHIGEPKKMFRPQFSFVAALIQIPGVDVENALVRQKGAPLTADEKKLLAERVGYARVWLDKLAPDEAKLRILDFKEAEKRFRSLDAKVKAALADFGEFFAIHDRVDEQVNEIKRLCAAHGVRLQDFFAAAYSVFIGRGHGPKLLPFLNALERGFAAARLKNAG
ncbi:MAG: lysine--tRNA ligase [Candidatus Norongarragalinales archaeon]